MNLRLGKKKIVSNKTLLTTKYIFKLRLRLVRNDSPTQRIHSTSFETKNKPTKFVFRYREYLNFERILLVQTEKIFRTAFLKQAVVGK